MPLHLVKLFQRPRQGVQFITQHIASGYRHSIMAKGGFDTASFNLQLPKGAAENAFEDYLGYVVRVYVDNPDEPIWEGFINRLTWRIGGVSMTRSFDNMMNRVTVTYWNADSGAANKTVQTPTQNNIVSQALYGIKEGSLEGGITWVNAQQKVALSNVNLALLAYPQISVTPGGDGDGIIEVECMGLQYFAWDWTMYQNTDAVTTDTADLAFFRRTCSTTAFRAPNGDYVYVVGTLADAGRFIATNAAFTIARRSQAGETYLQALQAIVEGGDAASVRYVFGITTPDPSEGLRYVYYRPASTAVLYTCYALTDTGKLRDLYGRLVPPWLVRPDAGVRINDILNGWDEAGDDPRIGYIEHIEYDAEAGTVQWQSGDDITLEGAMQRTKRYKRYAANDPFAPQPRQVY